MFERVPKVRSGSGCVSGRFMARVGGMSTKALRSWTSLRGHGPNCPAVAHFSHRGVLSSRKESGDTERMEIRGNGSTKHFVKLFIMVHFLRVLSLHHPAMNQARPLAQGYRGPLSLAVFSAGDRGRTVTGECGSSGEGEREALCAGAETRLPARVVRGRSPPPRARVELVMSTSACRRGLAVLLLGACAGAGSGEKLCNMPETGTLQAGAAASTTAKIRCDFLPRWWRNSAAARPGNRCGCAAAAGCGPRKIYTPHAADRACSSVCAMLRVLALNRVAVRWSLAGLRPRRRWTIASTWAQRSRSRAAQERVPRLSSPSTADSRTHSARDSKAQGRWLACHSRRTRYKTKLPVTRLPPRR